jgi:tetratricopeptide (TPR) repeat protein
MAKVGRNQPCPCGSGRKYKRCCWERDRAARVRTPPAVSTRQHRVPAESPLRYRLAETELDRLSNSVARLIEEGRLDEADAACEQLRTRYPEVPDWLMRKAMVCEARGEIDLAIEYCERTLAWMDEHPDDFEPASREPYYQDIERLRGSP